ncbi:hypothetical protein D3C87_111520 [compost metagenome]
MSLYCRIIQAADYQEILDFETKKLQEAYPDESDRMFASWSSKHRPEALQHYLPLGWSFLIRDPETPSPASPEGLLLGYFIAQPLLFLDGQTQSLWVEHVQYSSLQARDELCELAYKLAREKHLQRVYFPRENGVPNSVKAFKADTWQPGTLFVKTTK